MSVRFIKGPTILLHSGSYFDFVAPEQCTFTIEDIAHALSNLCRFAGHCGNFYSVAQHSVHVSGIVGKEHAYAGLMHDAAEAFTGDIPKPLKMLLPEFLAIEDRVEREVFGRFNVPHPFPEAVKEADMVMLATEQRQLMRNRDDWDYTRGRTPLAMKLPHWYPEEAEMHFLRRYKELHP